MADLEQRAGAMMRLRDQLATAAQAAREIYADSIAKQLDKLVRDTFTEWLHAQSQAGACYAELKRLREQGEAPPD